MRTRHPRQAGFTLVELMVAMALAVVLAGLAVGAVYSTGAIGSQRTVSAADKASGWLMTAKQRAMAAGNVQGIRFYVNGNSVTEAQYIEKPERPIVPNPTGDPNGARVAFVYVDASINNVIEPGEKAVYYVPGNNPTPILSDGTVNAGDFLQLSEFGTSYRIDSVETATTINLGGPGVPAQKLNIADAPDLGAAHSTVAGEATLVTYGVAFQPQARPLFGEPILQVGQDAVIDYRVTPGPTTLGVFAPLGYFDLMFASNGQVSSTGATSIIALWVRDPALTANPFDFANAGEQVLIVIYPKTGSISTTLVNPNPADPHKNAREAVNAGL